jgi:hypothetical protein
VEGGGGANNKQTIADEFVVITDVVTVFENNVDTSVVDGIDKEIFDLVMPSPGGGISGVLNLNRETFDYVQEENGSKKYYRKVSRYRMRVLN